MNKVRHIKPIKLDGPNESDYNTLTNFRCLPLSLATPIIHSYSVPSCVAAFLSHNLLIRSEGAKQQVKQYPYIKLIKGSAYPIGELKDSIDRAYSDFLISSL